MTKSARISRCLTLAIFGASIPLAHASSILPAERSASSYWVDQLNSGPSPSGNALKSWTLASGSIYASIPSNWNPIAVPIVGDDLLFGTLKSGNYSVAQDLPILYNNLTVNRALASEQISFGGIYSGASFRVVKGNVTVTTPTFSVSTPGTTNSTSSLVAGDGVGNFGSLTFTGVNGKYYDARVGVGGATGVLQLVGTNTTLVPYTRNTSDAVFGGAADAADATILVDAATLEAWVITTGIRGSTRLINGAQVSSVPTPSGVGQVQVGSPDASNVSFEVSSGADLRIGGQDGTLLIGSGVGATTDTKVISGGAIVSDFVITGAQSSTGSASSSNSILISGAGSTVTTTEAFDTNGGYRFSDIRRGSTTVTINGGGKLYTPRYDSNAVDRAADTGAASSTTLVIDGLNSLLQARTDVGGLFISNLGDRTTDNITVSNYAHLEADQIALGVGVGSTTTLNMNNSARVVTGLLEIARPFRAGTATTATIDVASSSKIFCANLVTSSSLTALTNLTLRGGGSGISSSGVALLGGVSGDATGGGSTNFNITTGASASFVALQTGGASAVGKNASYTGTVINLSGAGSQLTLRGSGGTAPLPTDLASNLVLSASPLTTTNFTVASGANLRLQDNNINPNLDGAIAMSTADGTVSTLIVDGPDTSVDAGKLITMSEVPSANAFTNATSTLTVRNGAFLGVYENGVDAASGNIQMAIRPSTNSTATLNIGGGTRIEDADTSVAVDGTLFVGGNGSGTPVVGGRSQVNLVNGSLAAAAIAVYANSKVTMTGGHLTTDNLMVYGGRVDMSATAPLTVELGALSAANGGVFNVGKGGAAVYYSTASGSGTDLDTIRQMIYNGSNGGAWNGANGITSSLLSLANPRYAIGYADIDAAYINSMLDLSFPPEAQAVVFRYTLRGDANLDGVVGFNDLLIVAQNYDSAFGKEWYEGDFNYTRIVNFDDLLLLSQTYGQTLLANGQVVTNTAMAAQFASDWALARSLVPEPTSIFALAGLLALAPRRR